MTTEAHLPQHESTEQDARIAEVQQEIAAHQRERIDAQKDALVADESLREVMREVVAVRAQAEGRDIKDLSDYKNFADFYRAARNAFDFRTRPDGSYGERWEAEELAKPFLAACSPELANKIYEKAELFGLTGDSEPTQKEAKAAVILGGGGKSPLDRTQYTADLIAKGKLKPEVIISLGSDRPIDTKRDENGENEYDRAGDYSEGAKDEYDLMISAAERVFGTEVTEHDVVEWIDPNIQNVYGDKTGEQLSRKHKVAYIAGSDEHPPVFIISSAAMTYPFRTTKKEGGDKEVARDRVNTEDTFAALARIGGFEPGSKIVAVTNAHFRPFQGAAASAQLGKYGLDTEVVGFDPQRYGNEPKRTDELLAEIATLASSLNKAD